MALQFQRGHLAGMMPGIISGYGGGTFNPGRNGLEQVSPLQQPMPPAPEEPKKPGAFGKGGDAWKIIGIIGDALQTAGGGRGSYAPYMADLQERIAEEKRFQQRLQAQAEQKRQEREAAAAEYDRRFGMQRESQRDYYDYQRENPKPVLVPDGMGGAQWITPPAYGGQDESGGGLPQGYDPNEWEVVEGGAGPGQPSF